MINGSEKPRPFIRDDPTIADAFGAHERLAKAIQKAIGAETPPRTIGVIGPWGSGKSSVVDMLASRLKSPEDGTQKASTFVFDAWLRQGEPIRRSFLEELVRFLAEQRLCNVDVIGDALDRLSGRLVVTRTTEAPVYSKDARLVIASVALGALLGAQATALKSIPLANAVVESVRSVAPWLPRFVPTLIPFLAIVWVLLHRAWYRLRNGAPAQDGTGEDLLTLAMERKAQARETRVVGTPVASAIEFQQTYWQLLEDTAKNGKRLVIVIDNLDRLPKGEALELWSLLRTFLVGTPPAKHSHVPPPTVIVPVALDAVESLYRGDGSEKASLADGFMQKTFDAVFYLARPVFTSWHDYFVDQMRATGHPVVDTDERERYALLHLVTDYFKRQGGDVTPRRVNAAVNLVASYAMQAAEDELPLSTIAYYCFNKDVIDEDIIKAVTTAPRTDAVLQKNWQRSIAALHFGVAPKNVRAILIETPLRNALKHGEPRSIDRLLRTSGAPEVFHQVLSDLAQNTNASTDEILNAARILSKKPLLGPVPFEFVCTDVIRAIERQSGWISVGEPHTEIAASFVEHVPSSLRLRAIVAFERLFGESEPNGQRGAAALARFWVSVNADPRGIPQEISTLRMPGSIDEFILAMMTMHLAEGPLRKMRPKVSGTQVVAKVAASLSDDFPQQSIDVMNALFPVAIGATWAPVEEAAAMRFRQVASEAREMPSWSPPANLRAAAFALMRLHLLLDPDDEDGVPDFSVLEQLHSENVLQDLLAAAVRVSHLATAGLITALIIMAGAEPDLPLHQLREFHVPGSEHLQQFRDSLVDMLSQSSYPYGGGNLHIAPPGRGQFDLRPILAPLYDERAND